MKRKTIEIVNLIERANKILAKSRIDNTDDVRGGREARIMLASFISDILMENGVYAGFNYLTEDKVPVGELSGIILAEDGSHNFPDDSRIFFYIHHTLTKN